MSVLSLSAWAGDEGEKPSARKPDCSSELAATGKSSATGWGLFSWLRPHTNGPLQSQRFSDEERKRSERRMIEERRRSEEKNKMIATLEEEFRSPEFAPEIISLLNTRAFKGIRSVKSASLIVGNPEKTQDVSRLLGVAQALVSQGFFVLYDADSSLAEKLQNVLGENGAGISAQIGRQDYAKNIFALPNDYLRLSVLASANEIAVAGNSATTTALIVNSNADLLIDANRSAVQLADWQDKLEDGGRRLGLKYRRVSVQSALETQNEGFPRKRSDEGHYAFRSNAKFKPAPVRFSDLSYEDLKSILAHRKFMTEARANLEALGGSVVFGSGQMDHLSVPKNYEIVYSLASKGAATTSGGAGGAMVVANTAAYDAGGKSIGIPIGGRNQLKSESRVYNEVQTDTVTTSGYEQRIPLLLHGKELVLVVPGGRGTMREIAVTLLKMAAQPESRLQLVLVDKTYYQGFYEWLKSRLPAGLLGRIHLVDGRQEFDELVSDLIRNGKLDWERLYANPPASPRTDQTSFPLEREEDRSSGWDFGDLY